MTQAVVLPIPVNTAPLLAPKDPIGSVSYGGQQAFV